MKKLIPTVTLMAALGMTLLGLETLAVAQGIFSPYDYSGSGAYDYRMSSALHSARKRHSSRQSVRRRSRRRVQTRHIRRRSRHH